MAKDWSRSRKVTVDVDDAYAGIVIEKISMRKGEMTDMPPHRRRQDPHRLPCPARGLIGYHGEFSHRHTAVPG